MAELTHNDIRRIARLARLAVGDDQLEPCRADLGAVLGYVERLGELDLTGVEPMTHPGGGVSAGVSAGVSDEQGGSAFNRLDADNPGPVLANDVAMGLAPDAKPPFFCVPKVLGDGGGA